jgi:hypothetical protein
MRYLPGLSKTISRAQNPRAVSTASRSGVAKGKAIEAATPDAASVFASPPTPRSVPITCCDNCTPTTGLPSCGRGRAAMNRSKASIVRTEHRSRQPRGGGRAPPSGQRLVRGSPLRRCPEGPRAEPPAETENARRGRRVDCTNARGDRTGAATQRRLRAGGDSIRRAAAIQEAADIDHARVGGRGTRLSRPR